MFVQKILKFAIPILFANLILAINGFGLMWILSRLGDEGVAAGALVYNTFGVMGSLVFAFSIPVSIFTARAFGGQKYGEIAAIWQAGAMVVATLGFIVAFGIAHLAPLYALFNQPAEASFLAAQFFQGYAYALIPFGLQLVLSQLMSGMSRPTTSTCFSFLGAIFTLPLGYWLALGGWGVHPMGPFGIGIGAAIGYTVVLGINLSYLVFSKHFRSFQLFTCKEKTPFQWFGQVFSMGIPISSQRVGEVTALFAITMIIGHLGQLQLTSYQIAMQFSFIVIMIGFGFAQTAGILVGQSLGAGKTEQAARQAIGCAKIAFSFALFFSLIFILFPETLIHVFVGSKTTDFKAIAQLATTLLAIGAVSQLADTLRNVTTGALRGYKDTNYPMMISLLACWGIAVPLAYFFSQHLQFGAEGAMWGFGIGISVGAFLALKRLHTKTKHHQTL